MSKVREGYKQTKVGVIPEEWEVVRLGDVGEVISGLTYSPKNIDKNGVLVLRSSNVQNRKLVFDDNVFVNVDTLKFNPVQENDILICVRNGSKSLIGKNALVDKENEGVAFGAFMSVYRSQYNVYMFQLFDTRIYKREVHRNLGATINSINGSDLKKFKIPLPPLKEQQKIAQILSTWDNAISKQEALIKAKEQLKKGLMHKLLSGEVRFEGFEGEWEEVRLGDISDIQTGSSNREDSTEEDGKYTFFDRSEDIRTSSRYLFEGEAVIVAGEGQRFLPKYFIGKFDLHQRTYSIMNFKKSIGKYIFYYIWENSNYFLAQAVGSTVKSLRLPMFKKMKIKLPPLKEQQKIAQVLSTADKEIELLKNELETLKEQKRGLMQRLLSGDVRTDNIKEKV